MQQSILQSNIENRGILLDPRTKLLLLITTATFVLGGAGGEELSFLTPCLCFVPLVLLLSSKKYRAAVIYVVLYLAMYFAFHYFGPKTTGIINFMLLGTAGIITRFMPSIMTGIYVVSTTTVSEFTVPCFVCISAKS